MSNILKNANKLLVNRETLESGFSIVPSPHDSHTARYVDANGNILATLAPSNRENSNSLNISLSPQALETPEKTRQVLGDMGKILSANRVPFDGILYAKPESVTGGYRFGLPETVKNDFSAIYINGCTNLVSFETAGELINFGGLPVAHSSVPVNDETIRLMNELERTRIMSSEYADYLVDHRGNSDASPSLFTIESPNDLKNKELLVPDGSAYLSIKVTGPYDGSPVTLPKTVMIPGTDENAVPKPLGDSSERRLTINASHPDENGKRHTVPFDASRLGGDDYGVVNLITHGDAEENRGNLEKSLVTLPPGNPAISIDGIEKGQLREILHEIAGQDNKSQEATPGL